MLGRYFLFRTLSVLPTLFGISVLCFLLVQLTPGGPVEQALAEWRGAGMGGEVAGGDRLSITEEQRAELLRYFGFDRPLHERYFRWIGSVLRLDFGTSYHYGEPVLDLLWRTLPVSLLFGIASFFATYLVCIPLGVAKAVKDGTPFDAVSSGIVFFLYAIPPFALGIVLIVLFGGGSFFDWFPIQGLTSENFDELSFFGKLADLLHHLFLPLVCHVVGSFAMLTMMTKNSLLEQLRQDYVLTARAKGLDEKTVLWKHAFRNALLPIASNLGQWLSVFFTGSLLLETIFGLNGIGRLSYESIVRRDYPIVLANILILSTLHIAGNLLSDLLYVKIDPRIEFAS
jgi:microcin C transport system permease protein